MTVFILLVVFVIALLFVIGLHTHDRAGSSIEIDAPAKDVWKTLVEFENYGEWNPFITNIDGSPRADKKIKVTIALPFKQSMDFNLTVQSVSEGSEMVWCGQTLEPRILDGVHSFRIEVLDGNRTRFSQEEKFSGLLLYLSWPLLKGSVVANFDKMNSALKTRVEGAELTVDQGQLKQA